MTTQSTGKKLNLMRMRPICTLLAAWVIPSTLVMVYITLVFAASRLGVLMHMLVLTTIFFSALLLLVIIRWFGLSLRIQQLTMTIIFTNLFVSLLVFDALSILATSTWGAGFTLELLHVYAHQIPYLIDSIGVSMWSITIFMIICCGGTALIIFNFSAAILQSIQDGLGLTKQFLIQNKNFPLNWLYIISIIVIPLIVLSYIFFHQYWATREPLHLMTSKNLLIKSGKYSDPPIENPKPFALNKKNLILITVDALRSDQMGVYGANQDNTPFLSQLLKDGKLHRIDGARSVCSASYCGILGTLASRYWRDFGERPTNLADVLKSHGYDIRFILSGDHTNFVGLREQYGNNIDLYIEGSTPRKDATYKQYVNDDRYAVESLQQMQNITEKPLFLYTHLMSVHQLGFHQIEFKNRMPNKPGLLSMLRLKTDTVAYSNQYNNSIQQADDKLKQIFKLLNNKGFLENAMVVITADHGEMLGEFGIIGHGGLPYEPAIQIPLLIYDTQTQHYPSHQLVSQIDIAPTMLAAIGAPIPYFWSGQELQNQFKRNRLVVESSEAQAVIQIIDNITYKYMKHRTLDKEWLFDLTNQPNEENNLASAPNTSTLIDRIRESFHQEFQR